ncbi:hypothetical protein NDU88_006413 [Pleurodeles waltl]|uniref:Uncharacterized protein n=1 Tax=Pleurodeles waltl TaxID=8319 RepID=A0AAV7WEL5_PLEWA|nr:hypothetical protein NDU88_006413 [Pleurodeles waltl]
MEAFPYTCLLFAHREVPPKGVGFSPFELLYGHPVRGPLSIVKEGWEKAPKTPPQDVVSYMLALYNQTQCFWKQAKGNLEASQELMKEWYDRKATLVEFSPGNKVWIMEPVEPRALQDYWTGPFEIKEQKREAIYLGDLKNPRPPQGFSTTTDSGLILRRLRLSDKVKACIKEEVAKMLALGVTEKSRSPWASPVVLVPKAATPGAKPELRFYMDYRGLNSEQRSPTSQGEDRCSASVVTRNLRRNPLDRCTAEPEQCSLTTREESTQEVPALR